MQPARRALLGVTVAFALTVSISSLAQTAGKDYTPISPAQPTDDPAKIEVLEFFSYGCPHCSDFHPLISSWAAKLPGDVVLKRVPITFGRAAWANIAKLYYALEATSDLARLDTTIASACSTKRPSSNGSPGKVSIRRNSAKPSIRSAS